MEKIKYLEIINATVNRLANQSSFLKLGPIVLLAVIFSEVQSEWTYLLLLPILVSWLLDGFFLHQERLYRALFENVSNLPKEEIDFTLSTVSVSNFVGSWRQVMFSKTLVLYHGCIIITIGIFLMMKAFL